MANAYLMLALSVGLEVLGTVAMQASAQFTRPLPALGVVVGYGGAIWFFMKVLERLPLGITYAIWAGSGIVLTVLAGALIFRQRIDLWAALGIALIVAGITVIHLFSRMKLP